MPFESQHYEMSTSNVDVLNTEMAAQLHVYDKFTTRPFRSIKSTAACYLGMLMHRRSLNVMRSYKGG